MDLLEAMRFTLAAGSSLRGDPKGAWTTFRHLEEKVAAERSRIRRELEVEINKAGAIFAREVFPEEAIAYLERALDRICPEEHS